MIYALIAVYVLGFGFVFRNRYKAYLTAAHQYSYKLYKALDARAIKTQMEDKIALAVFMAITWPISFWLPLLKSTVTTDVEKRIALEQKEAELKELMQKIDAYNLPTAEVVENKD